MIQLADVHGTIAASRTSVWDLLADFGRPDRLVPGLGAFEVSGQGVGMIRTVHPRGRTIHEQLLVRDPAEGTFAYKILPAGDMPLPGLLRYVVTVQVQAIGPEVTAIHFSVVGETAADLEQTRLTVAALYRAGLDRIAATLSSPPRS